jgi:hypothetical protein
MSEQRNKRQLKGGCQCKACTWCAAFDGSEEVSKLLLVLYDGSERLSLSVSADWAPLDGKMLSM